MLGRASCPKYVPRCFDPRCVVLGLSDSEATRAAFPFGFSLRYSVTIDGPESVSTALFVQNTSDAPLEFTGALHLVRVRVRVRVSVRVRVRVGLGLG